MTSSHPLPAPCQWFARFASALDRRSAPWLALLFLGAVRGRGTVAGWIRAAGLSDQFRPCGTAVAAAGKKAETVAAHLARTPDLQTSREDLIGQTKAETVAAHLVRTVVKPLLSGVERLTLALDDTPTPRYGPHVQGGRRVPQPDPRPGRRTSTATSSSSSGACRGPFTATAL